MIESTSAQPSPAPSANKVSGGSLAKARRSARCAGPFWRGAPSWSRLELARRIRWGDDHPCAVSNTSCLFELDERAAEILGMQEQHGLAMGTDLGFAIAENARSRSLETIAGRNDIVDFIAKMMNATVGIAFEKLGDWRIGAKRLQQFYLRVRENHEYGRDAVLGLRDLFRDLAAKRIAIDRD